VSLPYHLLYLVLGCIHLAVALAIYAKRPDLRRTIITMGSIGGFVEVMSEVWYEKDYWHPLTVVQGWPAPEDFIYGFGVTAMAVCVAPVLVSCTYVPDNPSDKRPFKNIGTAYTATMIAASFAAFMMVGFSIEFPSIWNATSCYFAIGLGLLTGGWRFAKFGLLAALVMGVFAAVGYGIGLNFLIDGDAFLRKIWLLYGTDWDIRIVGNVPLDEVAWNVVRAWCFAILYPVLTWQRLAPLPSRAA